jgi:outer membrane protein TolC
VAVADLFPKFSLSGTYGVQAPQPGNFDSPQALTWSGGAGFRWALFSTGKILNNITFTKARQREAVLAYQQTLLNALADVESRLKETESASQTAALALTAALEEEKRATLAATQHTKGLLNGLEKAGVELEALQAEDLALQTRLQALSAYTNLHQSLGQ